MKMMEDELMKVAMDSLDMNKLRISRSVYITVEQDAWIRTMQKQGLFNLSKEVRDLLDKKMGATICVKNKLKK